ncbi:hypothetical protein ACFB49_06740 [Sphingomonas sp. DBB INV C78]|uniref:hypothetical protein n=1 Tax=Sphingomonas sp. DBB INV C78 TaxID=3349434 RepID=UPI0036D21F5D
MPAANIHSHDTRLAGLAQALQSCYSSGSFNQELDALVSILNAIPTASGATGETNDCAEKPGS